MQHVLEMRRQRKMLVEQARGIANRAGSEKRALTSEESAQIAAMEADIDRMKADIDRAERLDDESRALDESASRTAGREDSTPEAPAKSALRTWLRGGEAALTSEQRSALIAHSRTVPASAELRAQSTTGSAGGYTIAQDFFPQLTEAMLAYGGMRDPGMATVIQTDTGAALPMPSVNETGVKGEIIGEGSPHNAGDITFGTLQLDSYLYSSKIVLVSVQLLQDTAFDLEGYIGKALGTRLARIQNDHFTTGTGTGQPKGIIVAGTQGAIGTGAANPSEATGVAYDRLVDLVHSIDPEYRRTSRFMLHDTGLKAIRKIKDSTGVPIWQPGLALREPDSIMGYGYTINQSMATLAANSKSIAFGDFSNYYIRDVRGFTLLRLVERYAENLQVGFLAFMRSDGDLLNAGTDPVKYLTQAAT